MLNLWEATPILGEAEPSHKRPSPLLSSDHQKGPVTPQSLSLSNQHQHTRQRGGPGGAHQPNDDWAHRSLGVAPDRLERSGYDETETAAGECLIFDNAPPKHLPSPKCVNGFSLAMGPLYKPRSRRSGGGGGGGGGGGSAARRSPTRCLSDSFGSDRAPLLPPPTGECLSTPSQTPPASPLSSGPPRAQSSTPTTPLEAAPAGGNELSSFRAPALAAAVPVAAAAAPAAAAPSDSSLDGTPRGGGGDAAETAPLDTPPPSTPPADPAVFPLSSTLVGRFVSSPTPSDLSPTKESPASTAPAAAKGLSSQDMLSQTQQQQQQQQQQHQHQHQPQQQLPGLGPQTHKQNPPLYRMMHTPPNGPGSAASAPAPAAVSATAGCFRSLRPREETGGSPTRFLRREPSHGDYLPVGVSPMPPLPSAGSPVSEMGDIGLQGPRDFHCNLPLQQPHHQHHHQLPAQAPYLPLHAAHPAHHVPQASLPHPHLQAHHQPPSLICPSCTPAAACQRPPAAAGVGSPTFSLCAATTGGGGIGDQPPQGCTGDPSVHEHVSEFQQRLESVISVVRDAKARKKSSDTPSVCISASWLSSRLAQTDARSFLLLLLGLVTCAAFVGRRVSGRVAERWAAAALAVVLLSCLPDHHSQHTRLGVFAAALVLAAEGTARKLSTGR
eukprot:Rhum_TRINITY_DN9094_c0_g1::Rhum_TRINITY_DN9094_c0_g1_i1::g.31496::m.31496